MNKDRFIESLDVAQLLLDGQPLSDAQAQGLDHKLQMIADALVLPLSARSDGREAARAQDTADGLFELLENHATPPQNVPALKRFVHRFATYKAPVHLRWRSLKMMKQDIDRATDDTTDNVARNQAETAYVTAFRAVADDFAYAHLRGPGMDETVNAFATYMPDRLRLAHQSEMLRHLGNASQRSAFSLNSFEPFANILAGVAKTQAWGGETKALIDPVVEHTAHSVASATRQQLDQSLIGKMHGAVPEFSGFFTDMNRRLRGGYQLCARTPKSYRRTMAAKAMLYSLVLDNRTRHSNWFDARNAGAVATINAYDTDPTTRHAMWRLRRPFQALFVPRRTPRRLPLDNKTLAEDISAHLQHNEPLAPWLIKHFKGRNSRFAAPCPVA